MGTPLIAIFQIRNLKFIAGLRVQMNAQQNKNTRTKHTHSNKYI